MGDGVGMNYKHQLIQGTLGHDGDLDFIGNKTEIS